MQWTRWGDILQTANLDSNAAVMLIYISDGWACWMSDNVDVQLSEDITSRHETRYKAEWVMRNTILNFLNANGHHRIAMKYYKHRLMNAKSCWHIFNFCLLNQHAIRCQRQQGVVISVNLHDGLHYNGFVEKATARHLLLYCENCLGLHENENWLFVLKN